jgi:hypothetical protein
MTRKKRDLYATRTRFTEGETTAIDIFRVKKGMRRF